MKVKILVGTKILKVMLDVKDDTEDQSGDECQGICKDLGL